MLAQGPPTRPHGSKIVAARPCRQCVAVGETAEEGAFPELNDALGPVPSEHELAGVRRERLRGGEGRVQAWKGGEGGGHGGEIRMTKSE